jgi:hypothetical protein
MYYVCLNDRNEILRELWFESQPKQPNPVKGMTWYSLINVIPVPSATEKLASTYTLDVDINQMVVTRTYDVVNKTAGEIAVEAAIVQKAQDIADNLPTWQQVSDAIDAATTLAAMKVIVKKLAKIVYWLAKNSAT